jgi:hypothetical protein
VQDLIEPPPFARSFGMGMALADFIAQFLQHL